MCMSSRGFHPRVRTVQAGPHGETALVLESTEFVCDVYTAPTWTNAEQLYTFGVFDLNAGIAKTFPVLSRFARLYGQYKLVECSFTYESSVVPSNGEASGTIVMTTLYNPTDSPPTSKRDAENMEFVVSGSVVNTLAAGIVVTPSRTVATDFLYTRSTDLPGGPSAANGQYDYGRFVISVQGVHPNFNCGAIHVKYTCILSKLHSSPTTFGLTGIGTLPVGEGLSVCVKFSTPSPLPIAVMYGAWTGVWYDLVNNTTSLPDGQWVPVKFPMASLWRGLPLAAGGSALPPFAQVTPQPFPPQLNSIDATQPNWSVLPIPANDTPPLNSPYLSGWTMSRDVVCANRIVRDPGGHGGDKFEFRIQFIGAIGATYSFQLSFNCSSLAEYNCTGPLCTPAARFYPILSVLNHAGVAVLDSTSSSTDPLNSGALSLSQSGYWRSDTTRMSVQAGCAIGMSDNTETSSRFFNILTVPCMATCTRAGPVQLVVSCEADDWWWNHHVPPLHVSSLTTSFVRVS